MVVEREVGNNNPDNLALSGPSSTVAPLRWSRSHVVRDRLLARSGIAVALLSLVLSLIWIVLTPPLRGPDEAAHLMAVMEVRTLGRLPEIHYEFSSDPKGRPVPPESDEAVAAYAKRLGVPAGAYSIRYESMQPPLFYLAAAMLSYPFSADPQTVLYISKLTSALFGAFAIYFIWAAVRQLAPGHTVLATLAASYAATLPIFAYSNASATNDSALYAAGAALCYVWFRGLREPGYDPYLVKAGALMGLGLLAKLTMLALAPAFALVILFHSFESRRNLGSRLGRVAILSLTSASAALAVAGWWLVRNLIEYGEISGSADAVKWYASQYGHADLSSFAKVGEFISATLVSFVGLFSWDARVFPTGVNLVAQIGILTLALLSSVMLIRRAVRSQRIPAWAKRELPIMLVATAGVVAGYIQFNVNVSYQPQARYLFVLLLPISLALVSGLYMVTRRSKIAPFIRALPIILLMVLNGMAIALLSSG